MTLRPTEEEEEAKAENAKGIEKGGVQQNGLQNGQDGAANQKVSCCRRMSLLLLCHQAHTLRLLLQNSAGQAAEQADCIGQSKKSACNGTAGACLSGRTVQSKQQTWPRDGQCATASQSLSSPFCTSGLVNFFST